MITLDGVMQAPGGSKEDAAEGFEYGGWTASYNDEVSGKIFQKLMQPADYLLGRTTFKIWESYWPNHGDFWPAINSGTKYVLSNTVSQTDWKGTEFLTSVEDIKKLKESDGADLQVWGSSKLIQLLLKNDLVDELWLMTFPITLGQGKKLFTDGAIAAAFTLAEGTITPSGVVMANYKRAGDVKTGEIEV
jgi:dihydrofolate reductase